MYTSTPINATVVKKKVGGAGEGEQRYAPEFLEAVHMDLKRDDEAGEPPQPEPDFRPLFEKYQFLTPGISPLPSIYSWASIQWWIESV